MRNVQLLVIGTRLSLGLILAACEAETAARRPGGLPTESGIVDVESVGGLCLLRGDLRPLIGTVQIDVSDPELVWIEKLDGTRASVRWPAGFWLDRETPAVRDVKDAIAAIDGTSMSVDTRDWQAKGTPGEPFVLVGDINGRCYG